MYINPPQFLQPLFKVNCIVYSPVSNVRRSKFRSPSPQVTVPSAGWNSYLQEILHIAATTKEQATKHSNTHARTHTQRKACLSLLQNQYVISEQIWHCCFITTLLKLKSDIWSSLSNVIGSNLNQKQTKKFNFEKYEMCCQLVYLCYSAAHLISDGQKTHQAHQKTEHYYNKIEKEIRDRNHNHLN